MGPGYVWRQSQDLWGPGQGSGAGGAGRLGDRARAGAWVVPGLMCGAGILGCRASMGDLLGGGVGASRGAALASGWG